MITDAITKFFFSYELAVDVNRDDLVKMSALDIKLVHPEEGAVAGLQLQLGTTITTTIVHKDPEDIRTILYLWKYDRDQLSSTSFAYKLFPFALPLSVSLHDTNHVNAWRVTYDHSFLSHDMYRGWNSDDVSTVSGIYQAGINRSVSAILSMGYALPGVECWTIPVLGFLAFPPVVVCKDKAVEGSTSTDIGAHVVMDVFPRTLDQFMQTSTWAPSIRVLDKDGDGLIAKAYGGNDPDDTKWDTDGDGLSDGWEMQMSSRRADQGGSFFDPTKADTDGDGLSDYDEMIWGTNPNGSDSDGDGITDPSEVQGWLYHYITPAGAEKVTRIYTDPLNGDVDNDGMDDLVRAHAQYLVRQSDRCRSTPPVLSR